MFFDLPDVLISNGHQMPLYHPCDFLALRCTSRARVTVTSRMKCGECRRTSGGSRSFLARLIILRVTAWRNIYHSCWNQDSVVFTLISHNELGTFVLLFVKWTLYNIMVLLESCSWFWDASVQISTLVHCLMYRFLFVRGTLILDIVFLWWPWAKSVFSRAFKLSLSYRSSLRVGKRRRINVRGWGLTQKGLVVSDTVDFKIAIEKDVLVILLQLDLKHEFVLVALFLPLIVIILNFVLLNFFNSIKWQCWYRSGQVAHRLIVILVVAERFWREL